MTSIIKVLTVSSREVALVYQTAANLLKDTVSGPIRTTCNNQHLPRLSYLVRITVVVRIAKSIK